MKRIPEPEIQYMWFGPGGMLGFDLVDGRVLIVPVDWFPRLLNASNENRADYTISPDRTRVHWPAVDEDISVRVLMGLPS